MLCKTKKEFRTRRHLRIRKKVAGTATCPRMAINLSLNHIYIQIIDDDAGVTLASACSTQKAFKATGEKTNMAGATVLGKMAAEAAKAKGVTAVVFDRGGFRYHGRVKALADAAREAGLQF